MRGSKARIPPAPTCADVNLDDWADCLILGINRARTVARLNRMYVDWKEQIEKQARRGEIIEAMRKRKGEL